MAELEAVEFVMTAWATTTETWRAVAPQGALPSDPEELKELFFNDIGDGEIQFEFVDEKVDNETGREFGEIKKYIEKYEAKEEKDG